MLEDLQYPGPQVALEANGQPAAVLGRDGPEHRRRADAQEAVAYLRLGDLDPSLSERYRRDPRADRLTVDQHAVQIEDDEVEAGRPYQRV